MDKEGLKGPSSTWTYLVTDNPFSNWFERLYKTVTNADDLLTSLKRAVNLGCDRGKPLLQWPDPIRLRSGQALRLRLRMTDLPRRTDFP